MCRLRPNAIRHQGFTLIEVVIVIVLIGIVGAMVGTFLRGPIDAYIDTARRAELTDIADTTLRRISEDIHGAVPNSVRTSADGLVMEMVASYGGGSFEAPNASGDSSIKLRGGWTGIVSRAVLPTSNFDIVIWNTSNNTATNVPYGYDGENANLTVYVAETNVSTSTSSRFRIASGATIGSDFVLSFSNANRRIWPPSFPRTASRFQIPEGPVSYFCNSTDSTLYRFSGYAIQPTLVTDFATLSAFSGVRRDIMAVNVVCTPGVGQVGSYFMSPRGAAGAGEIIHLRLQLLHAGGESVILYHDVTVINGA